MASAERGFSGAGVMISRGVGTCCIRTCFMLCAMRDTRQVREDALIGDLRMEGKGRELNWFKR